MAIALVRDRLPDSWDLVIREEVPTAAGPRLDGVVELTSPDRQRVVLLVKAKRLLNTRDVLTEIERLNQAAAYFEPQRTLNVFVARYLAPPTRERITQEGAAYIDATGNMQIAADAPALFLGDRGADRDPWRSIGRPRGTLKGPAAARVVRALADFTPPYTVPELIERAKTSNGATYRVVELLEQEDLLTREPYGPITSVRWREILMRWSKDYGFAQSGTVATLLEPRGLPALQKRLAGLKDQRYVLTGSLATGLTPTTFPPYAQARLAMLYVPNIELAKLDLELRETGAGGNVALAATKFDVVFERTETVDNMTIAALTQVAVDLLTGPGRNPSEAVALLDWMEANEPAWRR